MRNRSCRLCMMGLYLNYRRSFSKSICLRKIIHWMSKFIQHTFRFPPSSKGVFSAFIFICIKEMARVSSFQSVNIFLVLTVTVPHFIWCYKCASRSPDGKKSRFGDLELGRACLNSSPDQVPSPQVMLSWACPNENLCGCHSYKDVSSTPAICPALFQEIKIWTYTKYTYALSS